MSEAEPGRKGFRVSWGSWAALLAIIAVIAALAIPSYGDYRHRAQAAEAIVLMASAKSPLAEYFANNLRWPSRLEEVFADTSGKYTQSVALTKAAGSEIELTAAMKSEGVDRRVAGARIRMFSVDGGKTWACRGEPNRQNILPATCRD